MNEKKLGFGLMRLPLTDPEDNTAIDMVQTQDMIDTFIQRGFTYFDTAWMYHSYTSEQVVKEALVARHPRDSFTLATKLHRVYMKEKGDRERVFQEQLERTGAGYFDYYLLHSLTKEYFALFEEYDCFNWLVEKKQQGLVKHIGFSFHDNAEMLDKILTAHPEMEFVQLQINYLDWDSPDVQSRLCYETARRHGKAVIVMEPVKGGMLANLPPAAEAVLKAMHPDWSPASWAVRFAAGLPGVMTVLSGMSNRQQVLDNTGYMTDCPPLTEQELAALRQVVDIIHAGGTIPCTGCAYCVDGCPMNIPIPQCFATYNTATRQEEEAEAHPAGAEKASDCIACGQCVEVCPQHLAIPQLLERVAAKFDR
ncbi:MAG: aldo/keto reductase [Clostridia bacterium]|nr:aldo/keto reductase [Clostridia bacterium]